MASVATDAELAVLRDLADGLDDRAAALATTVEAVQSATAERTAGAEGHILSLDGHRRELDPALASLLGYPEHDFYKAVLPSAHDRGAYRGRREQLRLLASGELESVRLRSTHMHGQGLMVPVTGRISAVGGEAGQAAYLVLRAEERASR